MAAGASPAAIRSGLFAEDRPEFDAASSAALDEARRSYELAPLQDMLEEWRRRAVLQSDPAAFRRSVRRAAEYFTSQPVPDDEPFEVPAPTPASRPGPGCIESRPSATRLTPRSQRFAELRVALEVVGR